MSEPRFGENFDPKHPDISKRSAVLEKQDLPEYINLSRTARQRLKESVKNEGWPEVPAELENVEDLFLAAKNEVNKKWQAQVMELVSANAENWLKQVPENEENMEAIRLLKNPKELERMFQVGQLMVLEQLRTVAPKAWRSLLLLASERQLAAVALIEHWSRKIKPQQLEKMGINREELRLMVNFSALFGKYVDHAYIKQIEFHDQPGNMAKTKLGSKKGAEFLYDIYRKGKGDEIDLVPYSKMFPHEFDRIVKYLRMLKDKVAKLVVNKKLPSKYAKLPQYLEAVADVYGSTETKPKKAYDIWTGLNVQCTNLAEAGCPVMLLTQECQGVHENKTDIELRYGQRTERALKMEKWFNNVRNYAQVFLDKISDSKKKGYQIPKALLNFQPFAFGPNLHFFTTAESGDEIILVHTNAVEDIANYIDMPLAKKFLGKSDLSEKKFRQSALISAGMHEIGHTIISNEDEAIRKRLGKDSRAWVLEELKAESVGMKLVYEAAKKGKVKVDLENLLIAEIGIICGFIMRNSSELKSMGGRYHYAGVAMMDALISSGALKLTSNGYEITDINKAFKALSKVAEKALDFYTDKSKTKKEKDAFVDNIMAKATSESLMKVKEILKQ